MVIQAGFKGYSARKVIMKLQTADWISELQNDLSDLSEVFSTSGSVTPDLVPGERKSVAVLFLDLKGFTELSERLDHEIVHKITSNVMSRLSRLVEFHGGYVDKFEGDRIMALFGAEKAHENDCVRAVSCAARMIDAVQEFGALLSARGFAIDARAGVGYGDVTVAPDPSGHITATGDKVNIASRMEETAEAGTVQVTEAVREAAGSIFQWMDLGAVSVKGKTSKIHTFRPIGPGRKQIERWERAKTLSSVPFVGRRNELKELEELLHSQSGAAAGYNRRGGAKHIFAGIRGVAGIGKSRLIHEFRKYREFQSENVTILKAGCVSYAQSPLWLILSLIRYWLDLKSDALRTEDAVKKRLEDLLSALNHGGKTIRKDSIASLARLLSSGSSSLPPSHPDISADEARLQILSSITDLFRVLSDSSDRLVIVLDDVHWIDSASRECIEFLAASCDTKLPILFILMYRPEPDIGYEMIKHLKEEYALSTEIPLDEIDPESARELIRHLLRMETSPDAAVSEDIVEFLFDTSGGNAFFIEELVLGLTEKGLLEQDPAGEWILLASPEQMVIPTSIKGLIRARTDQLHSSPRRMLQIATVLGEKFNSDVLYQVASDTGLEDDPDLPFRELLQRGFLVPDDKNRNTVSFEHILARDAVYETILKQNRRYLHSLCAAVLIEREKKDPDLADLITRHLVDAGEIEKAIPWGKRAQDLAVERYDRDAVLFWSDKLENWIREDLDSADDAGLLVRVLLNRQRIEGLRLEWQDQRKTLKKLETLISEWNLTDMRTAYLMSVGSMHRRMNNLPEALEAFQQVLDLHRQSRNRKGIAQASSAIAMCNKNMGLFEHSIEQQKYAITLFREFEDIPNIARSLFRLASTMHPLGRYEEGLEILEEAHEYALKAGIKTVQADILTLRGVLQLKLGHHEEALQCQRNALTLYRELGDKLGELSSLNSMCNALYRMSRNDEARTFGLETLQASRELGECRSEANVLCTLGLVEWGSDRDSDAHKYFRDSLEAHIRNGSKPGQAAVMWNLSLLSMDLMNFEEGIECGRKSIELYKEIGNRRRVASKLTFQSITLSEMGRTDEAAACLREYEEVYADIDDPATRMRVSFAWGNLALRTGELNRAERYYEQTLELARQIDTNEIVPHALQNTGLIRLQQNRPAEALEYFRKGQEAKDGNEYLETFLAEAEYFLMTDRIEDAALFAKMAYKRAEAAGNRITMERSAEILNQITGNPG